MPLVNVDLPGSSASHATNHPRKVQVQGHCEGRYSVRARGFVDSEENDEIEHRDVVVVRNVCVHLADGGRYID